MKDFKRWSDSSESFVEFLTVRIGVRQLSPRCFKKNPTLYYANENWTMHLPNMKLE